MAACSNNENRENVSYNFELLGTQELNIVENTSYMFLSSTISIENDIRGISLITQNNGVIYGAGFYFNEFYETVYQFFSVDLEAEAVFYYPFSLNTYTAEINSIHSVQAMTANSAGDIFFVVQKVIFTAIDLDVSYYLKQIDIAGNIMLSVEITDFFNSFDEAIEIVVNSNGLIYIQTFTQIIVLNPDGTIQFVVETAEVPIDTHSIFSNGNGKVFFLESTYEQTVLYFVDTENQALVQEHFVPNALGFGSGLQENDMLFWTSSFVFFFDLYDKVIHEEFRWNDIEVSPFEISHFQKINSDQYIMLHWKGELFITDITVLSRVEIEEDGRQVLILGSLFPDYSIISTFNRQSTQYRIEVINYHGELDFASAVTRFTMDLMTGQGPDIVDLRGLNYFDVARIGLLKDLNYLFEYDNEIDISMFFTRVKQLLEVNDSLYAITPSFRMMTYVGPASIFGDTPGLTLDTLIQLEHSYNSGISLLRGESSLNFIEMYSWFNWPNLINHATGTAYFETDSFIRALEYAYSLQFEDFVIENPFEEDIRRGEKSLFFSIISDIGHLYNMEMIAGMPLTAVGFPSRAGVGSIMQPSVLYGIGANSVNYSGAWEFIKFLLSEEHQRNIAHFSLPVSLSVFNEGIQLLQQPFQTTDPNLAAGIMIDGVFIETAPMTQQQAERLILTIQTLGHMSGGAGEVMPDIIMEEALVFFNGDRTAQEAARIIQNRVRILVSERQH